MAREEGILRKDGPRPTLGVTGLGQIARVRAYAPAATTGGIVAKIVRCRGASLGSCGLPLGRGARATRKGTVPLVVCSAPIRGRHLGAVFRNV